VVSTEAGGNQSEAANIPISSNGSPWGVLSAFRATGERPNGEDIEYLTDICLMIGLAIESRRIFDDGCSTIHKGFISLAEGALADEHSLHASHHSGPSKSELLATVAHELRSPLTAVIGFTGMLLQQMPGSLNPEQNRQVEMIRASGRRLLDLIKDLLDLAKLALGETAVQCQHFDLNDALRMVATHAERTAAEKGIVFCCEMPESGILVESDRRMIEQVITELVDNAIKFTERGQIKVTATTLQNKAPGDTGGILPTDHACIQITDTGIGIAPGAMPRIFTAFGHAGHGKTHVNEGSRLGLALCKGLIDLLRGSLHVDSHPDRGSIFTIHLPLQWPSGVI
jgi:signal transduction histidine kinase